MRAVMQLAIVALVILPALPNRPYGPVLNPRQIWLMVVLIASISLGGYITYRLFGARAGTLLSGVLGGLISSTATPVGYARRAADQPSSASLPATVIVIASAMSLVRVVGEMAIVARGSLLTMVPPLAVMFAGMVALSLLSFLLGERGGGELSQPANPAELKSAVFFGVLYAVFLFAVAAVKTRWGSQGLYVVAVISGLTDMDSITLSTARLVSDHRLDADTGWRVVLIASLANTVFKGLVVAALGSRQLLWRIVLYFGLTIALGIAVLIFWPL